MFIRRFSFTLFIVIFTASISLSAQPTPFYSGEVQINPDDNALSALFTITFPSDMLSDGTLPVLMSENVRNLQITGLNILSKEQKPNRGLMLHELIFDPENTSDSLSVNFSYSIRIPADHQINRITNKWIELNLDSFWLPIIARIPKFNYELKVNIPSNFILVSGDSIINLNERQYLINSQLQRLDISFAAGKNLDSKDGSYSTVYSSVDSVDLTKIVDQADKSLRFYEDYINRPSEFKNKRIIIISPRKEVGYARKNYIVLSDIRESKPEDLDAFLAHEFAHYWFSNANFRSKHHWLTESFAEYMSMIYLRETYGQYAFNSSLEEKRERIREDSTKLLEFKGRPSYIASYKRGPLVLHAFEQDIGKDKFQEFIQAFIREDIRTNEALLQLIENKFGPKAKDTFIKLMQNT